MCVGSVLCDAMTVTKMEYCGCYEPRLMAALSRRWAFALLAGAARGLCDTQKWVWRDVPYFRRAYENGMKNACSHGLHAVHSCNEEPKKDATQRPFRQSSLEESNWRVAKIFKHSTTNLYSLHVFMYFCQPARMRLPQLTRPHTCNAKRSYCIFAPDEFAPIYLLRQSRHRRLRWTGRTKKGIRSPKALQRRRGSSW